MRYFAVTSAAVALIAPIALALAAPAAATINSIDFIGVGTTTKSTVDCYYNSSDLVCPSLAEYRMLPVGSRFDVFGHFVPWQEVFPIAEVGFSEAFLDGDLQIDIVWRDGWPDGFVTGFSFTEARGWAQFNNGIFIGMDLTLPFDICQGFGEMTYNGSSPTSGFIGVNALCGFADDAEDYGHPHLGFEGNWQMVQSRINDEPFAPVPEPQSWTMLIAGFGLVGAVLRRRARALAQ